MRTRNKRIEYTLLQFLKTLPAELLYFPLGVDAIIKVMPKCSCISYQDFARKHGITVKEVIEFCMSDTGCVHKDRDKHIIMYNDTYEIPRTRKNFTKAHEMGHVVLDHLAKCEKSNALNCGWMEQAANYFATCLLCPFPIFDRINIKSAQDIQRFCKVSAEAARIAWDDYMYYRKNQYPQWHNDIVRLVKLDLSAEWVLA